MKELPGQRPIGDAQWSREISPGSKKFVKKLGACAINGGRILGDFARMHPQEVGNIVEWNAREVHLNRELKSLFGTVVGPVETIFYAIVRANLHTLYLVYFRATRINYIRILHKM